MAFRFETANERWHWYKQSDTRGAPDRIHMPPTRAVDIIGDATRSDAERANEIMARKVLEFWRQQGKHISLAAAYEQILEIQEAWNRQDFSEIQRINSSSPGLIDFVKQLHDQLGWTPDPEAQERLTDWYEVFPVRRKMPGEQPGDPSPVLDEIKYPETNNLGDPGYGKPGWYDRMEERDDQGNYTWDAVDKQLQWEDFKQRKNEADINAERTQALREGREPAWWAKQRGWYD